MNQDECFEEMRRQMTPPTPALSYSVHHNIGASVREIAISLMSTIARANFFSCSIVSGPRLSNSATWLHRLESNLERHGEQFLFKASYRIHSSSNHRWDNSDDIYKALEGLQAVYQSLGPTRRNTRPTTREYRRAIDKIYSTLAGRTNFSTFPIDGRVITVLIGGKIPKREIFSRERAFSISYTTINDCHHLINWNRFSGSQFDSRRAVLDATFSDYGLPHGESFPVYGRLTIHERDTDAINVGTITNTDRRLLNKQTYYSDESLYTGYIPEANNLKEVLVPDKDGWALYSHKGEPPTSMQGKKLTDWLVDTKLHVSTTIELYRLSDGRSIRLQPGVYQLLRHDEEQRLTESLFVYNDNVRHLVESDYRATFPSGKLQAITIADDFSVVEVSHINVRDLTLPSEDESVTTFFQRSKNI